MIDELERDEEQTLFPMAGDELEPVSEETKAALEPAPERRRGGRKPDPNSARQQKLRGALTRGNSPTAPRRKPAGTAAKAAAKSAPVSDVYRRGASTILGWISQPLALGAMAIGLSTKNPKLTPKRREQLVTQANALTLDSLTIAAYEDVLADGIAAAGADIPWMASALERAAKIGPYAGLLGAASAVVLQVMCNHGLVPASTSLGTLTPDQLAAAAGVPLEPEPE